MLCSVRREKRKAVYANDPEAEIYLKVWGIPYSKTVGGRLIIHCGMEPIEYLSGSLYRVRLGDPPGSLYTAAPS